MDAHNFPGGCSTIGRAKNANFLAPAAQRWEGGAPLLDAHEILGPLLHFWPVLHIRDVLRYWWRVYATIFFGVEAFSGIPFFLAFNGFFWSRCPPVIKLTNVHAPAEIWFAYLLPNSEGCRILAQRSKGWRLMFPKVLVFWNCMPTLTLRFAFPLRL